MKVKLKEEKEEEKDELNLPIEILFQIFEYLDLGDFITLSSVSKRYRALTNLFWRKLCINFKFSNGENRFNRFFSFFFISLIHFILLLSFILFYLFF